MDNQKQKFSRALTEGNGKTIGINVDMNIQRTYLYLNNIIQKHKRTMKSKMTNAEVLFYFYEHNIFLFDPNHFDGKMNVLDIMSYYREESEKMINEIDDTECLESLECDDSMREYIKLDFTRIIQGDSDRDVNEDLEGDQKDCPKGEESKKTIVKAENENSEETREMTEEETQNMIVLVNKTLEMLKTFLIPLLALLSRSYQINDFKEIFHNEKTKDLVMKLICEKIDLKQEDYNIIISKIMNSILNGNEDIINNIREIYSTAPSHKIRSLIGKHFIPTNEEKKNNAEVPTPVVLVDEMLNIIPIEFWNSPHSVFEPCCGKGNFVLGIFDKLYEGMKESIPDDMERCKVIMTQCLYYGDLTAMNVFITTEILKCHIQSYTGLDELDYQFHSYTGDTLILNVEDHFKVNVFDAVIGNPPYSTDPSKHSTVSLYDRFVEKYIDDKILLFVIPSRWFVAGKGLDKFREFMMKRRDISIIKHEDDATKWFGKTVDIKGGVNYFLKDNNHNGDCMFNDYIYNLSKYESIIMPKYHNIIDNIEKKENITKIYAGRCFGIESNDKRLIDNGTIKCYVSTLKSKDRIKYVNEYELNDKKTFWKVITPKAAHKAFSGFGELFIGKPDEIHTGSYLSFRVNSEDEAKSLLSYLKTIFANHMLSVRKLSHNIAGDTCKWIPLVPLDRIWNDEMVCEFLKIEKELYM